MSLTHSLRREAEPHLRRLERLPRSFKRIRPPLIIPNQQSPNILANALNQTFQFNSTSATSHVPTTPRSFDAVPPVNNAVVSPTVRPQYRDIGVQKNLNFTRNTCTTQPSGDFSSCIVSLERENRDLRVQVETFRRDYDACRESLDEINRRYRGPSGSHHPPPPPNGPSGFTPYPTQGFSAHPRWRKRNLRTERQFQPMEVQEPEYPPIETLTLPTPPSPERVSPSAHRRTPTELRSLRMRGRDDPLGSQGQPYFKPQHHGRRRGLSEPNGRRQRGKLVGPPFSSRSGRVVESSVAPSSSTTVDAEVSGNSPTTDAAATQGHDKANDPGWW